MNITAEAAILLPLFLALGAFAGAQSYERAVAWRHARWRARRGG